MPGVTGTIRHPITGEVAANEWVKFRLVDSEGNPVKNAYLGTDPVVGTSTVQLSSTGFYTASLPASVSITPDGTRWEREHRDVRQQLTVPVSGTSAEGDILAEELDSVAPVELTSRLTRARLGVNSAALTLSFLNFVLVPNTVIPVTNIAQTVEVWAVGNIQPSLSGQCAAAIVPEGSTALGTEVAIFWVQVLSNNNVGGFAMQFDVAPSTPGNYQLAVYGASGTMIVAAKTSLTANAV